VAAVDFFSAQERAAFKEARLNERPPAGAGAAVRLIGGPLDPAPFGERATRRRYASGPIPAASLGSLLGLLRRLQDGDHLRYRYPSAGDTYAVQVYVLVKPGGVTGVPAGAYLYRPAAHELEPLGTSSPVPRGAHFYYNRAIVDEAGAEVYLVGQLGAIAPVYAENSERYLAIEAGHMAQLLMEHQTRHGIGLCPIGEVSPQSVRDCFALDSGHRFLLALAAGAITEAVDVNGTAATAPDTLPRTAAIDGGGPVTGKPVTGPPVTGPPQVAIVGLAGRFPGADDPEQLWQNLRTGARCVGPVPVQRRGTVGPGRVGGFLPRIDDFDHRLFDVPAHEAAALDPQLRLLLHAVWACLENAGHTAASLRRDSPRVGVSSRRCGRTTR